TIGPIEVRRTELHVPAEVTMPIVGPDLAAVVEVTGTYTGLNKPTPSVKLQLGTDFQGGDTKNYIITDPFDLCPDDANKTNPGQCGCDVPDTDSDEDGVPDCLDGCPNDHQKISEGKCGCGNPETDSDGDGTPDCLDGCPNDPNKIAPGR